MRGGDPVKDYVVKDIKDRTNLQDRLASLRLKVASLIVEWGGLEKYFKEIFMTRFQILR